MIMEKPQTTSKHSSSNALTYAMAVGMFTFFMTRWTPGGLSGVQGFFAGTLITLSVFIIAEALTHLKKTKQLKTSLEAARLTPPQLISNSEKVSITQAESERGLTIQTHVAK